MGLSGSGYFSVALFCKQGNDTSGATKYGNNLTSWGHSTVRKKDYSTGVLKCKH
jgi:hypothetical protein